MTTTVSVNPCRVAIAGLLAFLGCVVIAAAAAAEGLELSEAERSEVTNENETAWGKAYAAKTARRYDDAIKELEVCLLCQRRLGRDGTDLYVGYLNEVALVHELREDFPSAKAIRLEALAIVSKLFEATHWQVTDARLNLTDSDIYSRLTADQRKDLNAAAARSSEAAALIDRSKAAEAIAPAEAAVIAYGRLLGAEHRFSAQAIDRLALAYINSGDYAKAEPLYVKVLEIQKRMLGETHPGYALSLNNLARLYELQRDYAKAEVLYVQVLEIYKSAFGETHNFYAMRLNTLAKFYESRGNYAQAEPLYVQALDIRKTALGERHPDYAVSLNDLGGLYKIQGHYAKAVALCAQALEIRKSVLGEQHPDYAISLNNLASLYQVQGDYARAETLYAKGLEIRKTLYGEQHPVYATGLNDLAGLYTVQGYFMKAETLYVQALEIRKKTLGERHPEYALILNDLAVLYIGQGAHAQAANLFRQAQEIQRVALGERHPHYAMTLNNLAQTYSALGDFAKAESLYMKVLEIRKAVLGQQHADYATSLNDLASIYLRYGDYAKAEPLFARALEIRQAALGQRHPDCATSLLNLGHVYKSQGDYARAESLFVEALEICKTALGDRHPAYATSAEYLAGLYVFQAKFAQAEALSAEALQIRKATWGGTHPAYAVSLGSLAFMYRCQGDYAKAAPLYAQSLEISLENLLKASSKQSERQQLALLKEMRNPLDGCLTMAMQSGNAAHRDLVYGHVLALKGLIYCRQQELRALRDDPRFADRFSELQSVTSRLATLALGAPTPEQHESWRRQVGELSDRKEQIEQKLGVDSFEYRFARKTVTHEELRSALPEGAVLFDLLEYTHFTLADKASATNQIFERRLAAFVIRRDKPLELVALGDVAGLNQLIETWRVRRTSKGAAVRDDLGASRAAREAATKLRQKIWEPLLPYLADVRLVLVSPDGVVNRLPLAALPGNAPDTYLLEDYPLAMIPVPQALPRLLASDRRTQPEKNLLAVGGVQYDRAPTDPPPTAAPALQDVAAGAPRGNSLRSAGDQRFQTLAGSKEELVSIEKMYRSHFGARGITSLADTEASETALCREAPLHRYLHLATHGFFASAKYRSALEAQPTRTADAVGDFSTRQSVAGYSPGLLSGVALAGANDPAADGDDGILTAEEVQTLDLRNVELAILSACETGLGETAGGEGLLGLQRAFQIAGARATVTSLWKVDDAATRELMERFYDNLWTKKLGKLAALREAQLWMLREAKVASLRARGVRGIDLDADDPQSSPDDSANRRLPPKFWAAFILSGDWR